MGGGKTIQERIYAFLQANDFFAREKVETALVRKILDLPEERPVQQQGRVLTIYVDGSADLTRKRSGLGGVFLLDGNEVYTFSIPQPDLTNNEAEYDAMIHALELAVQFEVDAIEVFSDSELMVNQIKGIYKVKNERLRPRFERVKKLLQQRPLIQIDHVYRTANKRADQLAQDAMRASGKSNGSRG